ncbi:DNA polymerase III subunit gamma/tau [Pseudokordiimonas caeni]|uniref:DNA polymerase III subunit gamma/tau n=1 Tax=Pseudokordiimonas caeni TaxID=2997908 RepID=UPI002811D27D|nr:DNA polymerase III subunit gamma/tau [Pseudokordiimonas caeni]
MAKAPTTAEYRVLARKYRPSDFDALIGQEAMVRTLSNAIESGRLAHAFVLTGVRGVGKTTTARIIAKALNCTATDGPSINPCGKCESCVAIAESRHVDVLEMDAASRTGVDDIREIIESVRYAPVSARYKIYIIDEVHMLSKNAFNALLKTLEEPPAHVKFIFATTEIRKLPVTVLSRCQRFDLKRVESDVLVAHLQKLADAEGSKIDAGALKLIARAAEGSVRDSLSLLDQAIAHGAGEVSEDQVRSMLGLADRTLVLDLFEAVMKGDVAAAIGQLRAQYDRGADPAVVMSDLLEVTHWLTRLKVTPEAGADTLVSEAEKSVGGRLAEGLDMPHLTRAWSMLLKGLGEVKMAPSPIAAAEMVLIRLAYAANLPSPADLVKQMQSGGGAPVRGAQAPVGGGNVTAMASATAGGPSAGGPTASRSATVLAFQPGSDGDHPQHPMPISFEKMIALFEAQREPVIAVTLKDQVRLVEFAPGKLVLNLGPNVPPNLFSQMKICLKRWTGTDWMISTSNEGGAQTVKEQEQVKAAIMKDEALAEPLIRSFLGLFPDAELLAVRETRLADLDVLDEEADDMPGVEDEPGEFDF